MDAGDQPLGDAGDLIAAFFGGVLVEVVARW